MTETDSKIIRFTNCQILRNHKIIGEDLWVRNGKIVDPEPIYYLEKRLSDISIDCKNLLIVPGYIDLQINGEFIDLLSFRLPFIALNELKAISVMTFPT